MKSQYVNSKIEDLQEKHRENSTAIERSISDFRSSFIQITLLSQEVSSFVSEVINQAQEKASSGKSQEVIDMLYAGLQEVNKYISDKPSVIEFEVQKLQALLSVFAQLDIDHEELKKMVSRREDQLENIKASILKGEDPTKQSSTSRRVEKTKDVRQVQQEIERENSEKSSLEDNDKI